jgi:hypothetical protein
MNLQQGFAVGLLSLDFFGTMLVWLDASDTNTLKQNSNGTTAVSSASDPIGYWRDKSGNGYNVVQATSGNRASYSTTNGANVYFNGITNNFVRLQAPNSIFTGLGSLTTFTVYYEDATDANFGHVWIIGSYIRIRCRNGRGYNDNNNGNLNNVSGLTSATLNKKIVTTVRQNDGTNLNTFIYVNGVQTATHTITLAAARATTAGNFTIGNANYGDEACQGGIYEFGALTTALSASQVALATDSLRRKWSV